MKKTLLPLGLLVTMLSVEVSAYQFDIDVVSTASDLEFRGVEIGTNDELAFEGTFYTSGVNDNDYPLAVQPFIERSSNIGLVLSDSEAESSLSSFTSDTSTFSFDGEYYFDDNRLTGTFFKSDTKDSNQDEVETTSFGVGIGFFIKNTTLVEIGLLRVSSERNVSGFSADSDATAIGVELAHVQMLESGTLGLEATLVSVSGDGNGGTFLSFNPIFYPNKNLGVGLNFSIVNSDDIDTNSIGFNVEYYFNEMVSVGFGYNQQTEEISDIADVDADIITLSGSIRF